MTIESIAPEVIPMNRRGTPRARKLSGLVQSGWERIPTR
ncbi:MAG: hypothetical protein BWX47_00811 [candidate division Hyd24-12 bacterium ADurb.Bin004]|nr:MAG: hypothetical protein BWX47_00811 [candidate division Hyd24-12 bacterium ADurb.Bin004]